jgi:hypothetical protein
LRFQSHAADYKQWGRESQEDLRFRVLKSIPGLHRAAQVYKRTAKGAVPG